jgi:glucosamine--fructose-6-phosphate aminotransferase (isomerizing)
MKGEDAFGKIFYDDGEMRRLTLLSDKMKAFLTDEEMLLEEQADRISTADLEAVNRGLVLLRDLVWGLDRDILDNIGRICRLAGVESSAGVAPEALPKYRKMNFLLNGLDRLEVRGRDSAGIQISCVAAEAGAFGEFMTSLRKDGLGEELDRRMVSGDLADGSITGPRFTARGIDGAGEQAVSFTYKTAEIIGELGRNVRELRRQISRDRLFHAFARLPVAFETAFAHTRWASVGSITEENCHPIGNFTLSPGLERGHRQLPDAPGGPRCGGDGHRAGGDDGYEDHPAPDRKIPSCRS